MRWGPRGLAAIAAWMALSAAAQTPATPPAAAVAPAAAAPLVIMNRTITTIRAAYLGFSPAERAAQSRDRIDVQLRKGGAGDVSTQPLDKGIAVTIDGAIAFAVTPGDVDSSSGVTIESAARAAAKELQIAIAEGHESRDLVALSWSVGYAALGTILLVAAIWVLGRARRYAGTRLESRARAHAQRLNVAGVEILEGHRAIVLLKRAVSLVYWIAVLLLAYEWLGRTLEHFPYTRPWGEQLNGFLLSAAMQILEGIATSVPSLVIAVMIFFVAKFFAGLVYRFFERVEKQHLDLGWIDADTARPTRRLASVAVWLLAIVMAYPYLPGANSEAFKGMSVLVGLMVSLGGASVVGQALSGVILMYTRTFRVGEFVRVGDHEGTVTEIGMYQTRIRTGMGDEIYLPNALVLTSVTRNYSRTASGGYMMQASATIGYDVPWRQVHAMLVEAARRTPGVVHEPSPHVMQVALSDFYVEYRLICLSEPALPYQRAEAQSRLLQNIQDVFNENGVQIMSPHYFTDPAEAKVVPKARWYTPPAEPPAKPSA